ncbi:MAG: hypothetical protein QOE07_2358 [Acidimicrobiaceae bacterium]|nr:hypothetical protein [Acidimicrobiaceae bacterium]MDQ1417076.1 hypothetical protein [Acidimicrobiaceae bacterium]
MSRRILFLSIVALTITITVTTTVTPVYASNVSPAASSIARFEGHPIDLAKGWGAATACLVARQQGVFECFRTRAELAARKAEVTTAAVATAKIADSQAGTASANRATSSCSASLDLYSGSSYSGQELSLIGEGYWQQLSSAGFDNTAVSFLGGACSFHLAQGNFGQGFWYPGNTGAWSFASDMGSWDRTVSSVYIN